jgi:ammonium transporter
MVDFDSLPSNHQHRPFHDDLLTDSSPAVGQVQDFHPHQGVHVFRNLTPMRSSRLILIAVLLLVGNTILIAPVQATDASQPATVDDVKKVADSAKDAKQAGNIAWMLVATAFVMLMIPGLALFYGGMVRRKNVLGTMMQSMICLGIVGVQWVVIGYALAFGDSLSGVYGWNSDLFMLATASAGKTFPGTDCPVYLHAMFQGMFAIITVALISGAFAERVKFSAYCLFCLLWTTLVYDLLAHWVWAIKWTANNKGDFEPAGWLGAMGALDFAGGTVVHIAAGTAGLAAALLIRKRHGFPDHTTHPNSVVLTLLGAGLLWFGWFGFNAGSATASSVQAVSALTATQIAAAAAGLGWVLVEWLHKGKPTALGFASGVVAGLVAVTPASGYVAPSGALLIGGLAGVVCYAAVLLKPKMKVDDSLDAFGIHGIGGLLGAVLTGALVSVPLWRLGTGLDKGFPGVMEAGIADQLFVQIVACLAAAGYSFVATAVLIVLIDRTIGFTLPIDQELAGLDRTVHGEVGFDYVDGQVAEDSATTSGVEPRAASAPPMTEESEERFTLVVVGPNPEELRKAWLKLCEPKDTPASSEFKAVYRYMTTLMGNKFRFRGGNRITLRESLQKALEEALDGTPIKIHADM